MVVVADGVVNCSVADDLTGASGSEGANALVELMQSMALRRAKISFIILGRMVVVAYWRLVLASLLMRATIMEAATIGSRRSVVVRCGKKLKCVL